MLKNIIFDWSGTLSEDLPGVHYAAMEVFDALGLKRIVFEEFRREFDLPYMSIYNKYSTKKIHKKTTDPLYHEAFLKAPQPKPASHSFALLKQLTERKILLVLLSSHPLIFVKRELKDYGFSHFFKEVYAGVHDKRKKINDIMNENKFDPKETAFIGDMTHDI